MEDRYSYAFMLKNKNIQNQIKLQPLDPQNKKIKSNQMI